MKARVPSGVSLVERGRIIVVSAAEMREIDRRSIADHGVSGDALMERAGRGAVEVLMQRFRPLLRRGVAIVAGKGNNGGDALVMARVLERRRIGTRVFLAAEPQSLSPDAAANLERLRRAGGAVVELGGGALPDLSGAGVVVDGLFGTGLRGPIDQRSRALIEVMNASAAPILAVDVPSGLDADRGVALPVAVQAAATATFAFPKAGLLVHPGAELAGEIAIVDIGIPAAALDAVRPRDRLLSPGAVAAALPPRAADTHKGTYGHVLVLAGSAGKTGAAALAGRAALRAGAGLVTVASPAALDGVVGGSPELMTARLAGADGVWAFEPPLASAVASLVDGKDAVVFGPGVGTSPAARALTEWLVGSCGVPLLVDADGINCLAGDLDWLARRRAPVVLTPHPGEMARLLGASTAEVQTDRIGAARSFARANGVTVVLKGSRTIVASPEGAVSINPSGNPGMASGGMGDALSGVVGALLGQGLEATEAAEVGVFWHGSAGDAVARRRGEAGLLASDVIDELPAALRRLQASLFGDERV